MLVLFRFFQRISGISTAEEFGGTGAFADPTYNTSSPYQTMAKRCLPATHPGRDEAMFEGLDGSCGYIHFVVKSFNMR